MRDIPCKSEKDSKAVCKVTSTKKGVLVTTCCIIRADGNYLPPVLIFPRVNFRGHMMVGAPHNSLGLATPSGWMNTQLFVQTMQHFIKFSYSTKDNPSLLIYDNYESHINLDVFELAKANDVHILTLLRIQYIECSPLMLTYTVHSKSFTILLSIHG